MYKGDLVALDDLMNFSICVKEDNGIRPMWKPDDINKNLVYINNCSLKEGKLMPMIIKGGEYCRYIDLVVLGKTRFK